MDRLWSPWRYRYVTHVADDAAGNCVFCDKSTADPSQDRDNLVLCRGRHCFAILNLYPYTSGHLMVIPHQHLAELSAMPAEAIAEMMSLAQHAERTLREVYCCNGLNMGINLGRAAGAGIAQHLHLHVLPRWFGDSNFITTIAESRVIPEDLDTTWTKLRPHFEGFQYIDGRS